MSAYDRFAELTARIAVTPNIIRTRREDAVRAERMVENLESRVEKAVTKLEKVAAELEKALV